jgi:hypothetical protein
MASFFKTRTGRVLAVLVLLFILYTLAGFVVAPRIVRNLLIDNIQKSLGVTPAVGDVKVNPLLLRLEVRDFSLPAASGAQLLGFERFAVEVLLARIAPRGINAASS